MSDIGWIELLVIVAVVSTAILAPKNLPRLWRWLSRSMRGSEKGPEEDESGTTDTSGTDTGTYMQDKGE